MRSPKSGTRHPLLFYRRSMDRIWKSTLVLGLLLLFAGLWALKSERAVFGVSSSLLLTVAAIVALAVCVFAFLSRFFAYVQVYSDHLNITTPFLRLKISFRRIRNTHPVLIQQLFPKEESNWAQRSFLEPFYGKTSIEVEVKGFPLDPLLLRLFLPSTMFSPRKSALVLLVPDWMKLSTEIDSFYGTWLQQQSGRTRDHSYKR